MSPEAQFWWTWWVTAVVAAGTMGAVVVALFGDWLRNKIWFLRPRLTAQLLSREGKKTTIQLVYEDKTRMEDARYYHVRVLNHHRYSPVSQVQVILLRVEGRGPDGEWRTDWDGEAPFQWSLAKAHPLLRTIGPAAICDVCAVVKDKWLQLALVMVPNSLEPLAKQRVGAGKIDMVITMQARGTENDSEPLRLHISWNGKWADGGREMQNNLVIKPFEEGPSAMGQALR